MEQNDYLAHYGILGMKWGVRRYQNPDGTLTEEGRQRLRTTKSKTLDKLNRRSKVETERAKRDTEYLKELKKQGQESEYIQVKYAWMDEEAKNEAAKRGGYEDSLGALFGDMLTRTSVWRDSYALNQLVKEEIEDLKKDHSLRIKRSKDFVERYENLSMKDIDELAAEYGYKEAKRQIKRS